MTHILDSRLHYLRHIQKKDNYTDLFQRFAELNYCAARVIDYAATGCRSATIDYLKCSAEILWKWHKELSCCNDPDMLADFVRSEWNNTLQALNLSKSDKAQRIASDDYARNAAVLTTAMLDIVENLNGICLHNYVTDALAIILDWWDYELKKRRQGNARPCPHQTAPSRS